MNIIYILTQTGLVLIPPVFSFGFKKVYPDFGKKELASFWESEFANLIVYLQYHWHCVNNKRLRKWCANKCTKVNTDPIENMPYLVDFVKQYLKQKTDFEQPTLSPMTKNYNNAVFQSFSNLSRLFCDH